MAQNKKEENERPWVESIKELLEKELANCQPLTSNIRIVTQCGVPYTREVWAYTLASTKKGGKFLWPAKDSDDSQKYTTDLLIYEEIQGQIKPRIIIEAKWSSINSHDPITYSHKAAQHKTVTPYLRYGIMIGAMGDSHHLTPHLVRHGVNFDFMIGFQEAELTSAEKDFFFKLIAAEWHSSIEFEQFLLGSSTRKRYFMLHRGLQLGEIKEA